MLIGKVYYFAVTWSNVPFLTSLSPAFPQLLHSLGAFLFIWREIALCYNDPSSFFNTTASRRLMTKEELWQAVLAQLQFHISPANFATWLKNTFILSKKGGQLLVSVPNNFSKEWLENKYNKLIFKILKETDHEIKEILYTVEKVPQKPKEAPTPSPISHSAAMVAEAQLEFQEFKVNKTTNLNPKYTFENFIVGPFNELANAASLAITQHPGTVYNPLFVYGGVGLGKTHLLQATGNKIAKDFPEKKVRYISSERFTSGVVSAIRNRTVDEFRVSYRDIDIFILDDVQFLAGKDKTQEELFHTFNTLYEHGKQVVFSSDRPPKSIPALEERLRSRFEGGMVADVSMPDYETRLAILKSKMQEKNFMLGEDICEYIASHIQRNIRELEGALNRLYAHFRLINKAPTLVDAKSALKTVIQSPNKMINHKKIIQIVAEFYDIKEKDIIAPSRKKEVVKPRQIAMYLLREELKSSFPFIGKRFGGKDHTTAIYACEKIGKEMQESEILFDEINLIKQRMYSG
ncbi:MAG: chromosomal replication initiator protein DnaA [Candidatus Wildermuthbacteria bacterium]|nr:chromosomal replication initiator protein DnaA [Candidatus Wildermuthbacteria bacterium]